VGGEWHNLELLRERITRLAAATQRDEEALSTLRVTIRAPGHIPYGHIHEVMSACAAAGAWRVDWRLGEEAVDAAIHLDRKPPPFDQLSHAEYPTTFRVRGKYAPSGEVTWFVNRTRTFSRQEFERVLPELKERCDPTAALDIEYHVPYQDACAVVGALRHVEIDVLISGIAVPAPAGPDNPWVRGMADAERDASRGNLAIISYGLPGSSAFFIKGHLLRIRYGIISDHRGCCVAEGDEAHAEGYNYVSRARILAKYGKDVEAECEKDSDGLRQEVLDELRSDEEARYLLGLVQPEP
jgi:biopolymer transport protein ExbD